MNLGTEADGLLMLLGILAVVYFAAVARDEELRAKHEREARRRTLAHCAKWLAERRREALRAQRRAQGQTPQQGHTAQQRGCGRANGA